jgi:hypothetical protein
MTALAVQVGSTITNGTSALRVQRKGETGWVGLYVSMAPGHRKTLTGTPALVPFEDLPGWRDVPFEWSPCPGGEVEERYVWTTGCRALARQFREVARPVDCSAEHGAGQPDCPKCWRWSDRNPNSVPRPR